jgi:hypothetical protein
LSLEEVLSKVEGLDKFFDLAAKSQQLVVSINENYSKITEILSAKATELSKSFTNLNKLTTQQIKLQAETDIDIRRILGEQIKSADLNQLFDTEIRSITGGIIDPNDIGQEITNLIKQANVLQTNTDGLPENERVTRLAETTSRITRLNSALDLIINSGTKLKRAFEDLEKKEKKLFTGPQTLLDRLIEDPSQVRVIESQIRAFEKLASGTENLTLVELQSARGFAKIIEELGNTEFSEEILRQVRKNFTGTAIDQGILKALTSGVLKANDAAARIILEDQLQGALGVKNLTATPEEKAAALSPELKAIKTEQQIILDALSISKGIAIEQQAILEKSISEYSTYTVKLQDLLINEINLRTLLQKQLEAAVQQQIGTVQKPITDLVKGSQELLKNITNRAIEIGATRTQISEKRTNDFLDFQFGRATGRPTATQITSERLTLPNVSELRDIDSTIKTLTDARSRIQSIDKISGKNPLQTELDALDAYLERLRTQQRITNEQIPQEQRIPIQPGRVRGARDIIPAPSPLDTSSLDSSLNNFVGSFTRSLTDGLRPVSDIIGELNTVFSNLSSPIAQFTTSAQNLLAGLETFNSNGGIKGPNIPQEVTVSVTFDDTITVVADRNGNKDLLSQIGILVSDTVRRQLNEQNTFGDRRITGGGQIT